MEGERAMGDTRRILPILVSVMGLSMTSCGRVPQRAGLAGGLAGDLAGEKTAPTRTSPGRGSQAPSGLPGSFENPAPVPPPEPKSEGADSPSQKNDTEAPGEPANDSPAGLGGVYPALARVAPSKSYSAYFEASGRPRFGFGRSFQERLRKKFGRNLNQAQPATEKSRRLYQEMVAAVNRERPTERSYLLISAQEARRWSREIELNGGRSPKRGAYSIAVTQTAVRHGFANVPCAEFVSEIVREAYARADLDVVEDFNGQRRNVLLWSATAAVVELGRALLKAGWVPWATSDYRPPIGAILLNGVGETPGHAFLAAGQDGRFIVDNGAPQGRDLGGRTSGATIGMMFSAGVFFLPPGIDPEKWP